MIDCVLSLLLLLTSQAAPENTSDVPPSIARITPEMIQEDVNHLADDSFYGRYWLSPFAQKAADWIRDEFIAAGVQPGAADGAWFQFTKTKDAAPNVIGLIPGNKKGAGVIVLTAHYDHLPPRRRGEDKIFNGADDNASGTAGILAVARALVPLQAKLQSSVLFIAFTGEEAGLKGAKYFVRNPTVPLNSIKGLINLDMISRGEENVIFIDGAKESPDLIKVLRAANEQIGLDLQVDQYPDWLTRSDQWPFLQKGVQAVLFSVEDHEDYHEVTDHADRIIAPLAARVSQLIAIAVLDLAGQKRVGSEAPQESNSVSQEKEASQEP